MLKISLQYDVHLLRPQQGSSIDRLAFGEQPPARMADCTGRIKNKVKHISLNYATALNDDKRPKDKIAYVVLGCFTYYQDNFRALYDGTYDGESHTKTTKLNRDAVGFIHDGKLVLAHIVNS